MFDEFFLKVINAKLVRDFQKLKSAQENKST